MVLRLGRDSGTSNTAQVDNRTLRAPDPLVGDANDPWLPAPLADAEESPAESIVCVPGEVKLPAVARKYLRADSDTPLTFHLAGTGLLLSRADPVLSEVYVEPTNRCNLACRTCVRHSWQEPYGSMAMATYRRLIDGLRQMPGLRRVSFWGLGEPLLHPDILEMVGLAHELGAETHLITNAVLLDAEKAEGLVKAGLDRLFVSIDGVAPETQADIRSGSELGQVQQNLGFLHEARRSHATWKPEIGIEFVVMRRNLAELPHLRKLAFALQANLIVLTNVLPYTEEMKDEILYWFSAGRSYPTGPSPWFPDISFPRLDAHPALFQALPGLLGEACSVGGTTAGATKMGYCRFVEEGSIAVGWDGTISPCVPLMHDYACYILGRKKTIRRCTLGNLNQGDLSTIWESVEFRRIRDVVRRFPFSPCTDCGGCDLSESNEQDCLGNTFPVCGDCLWAKGVIQCP